MLDSWLLSSPRAKASHSYLIFATLTLCGFQWKVQAVVVAAYREMAAADPDRWLVVDGNGSLDEVAARVAAAVEERLG